ncbi:MAG: SpoIIE family protein phosphatase [Ruminococcus sp.]|nr:SpoIIE family protein phosphatase [Ruminococcus sp.]
MIKKFGLTLGGLQQKILNLVLIFLLALMAVYAGVSIYQSNRLTRVVNDASSEQQEAIEKVSGNTMHQVIDGSMTKTNALQAYIADDMFIDIKTDVATLQSLATGLFEHMGSFEPAEAALPDPAKDGTLSAQVLCEEGVDYTKSEYLGTAAHMSETMIAMCERSEYLSNCFIGLADGTLICVDKCSASKFDESGKLTPFAVRERPWYTGAVEAGELWFSGIEADTYTDNIGVECAAPVYKDGKVIGVVGADLFLNSMSDYVNSTSDQGGYICVINSSGNVIFAPEGNGVFDVRLSDEASDIRQSDNKELAEFVSAVLTEQQSLTEITVGSKVYYMTGSPMPTIGWAVVSFIEKDITEQPTQQMMNEYDRINQEASSKFNEGTDYSRNTTLVMIGVILVLGTAAALAVAGRVVKPLERMTQRMSELKNNDLLFEMEDTYRTGDEVEMLAEAFAELSKKTTDYINQITVITAEKERIGTELELATRIQADMLPNIFPAFPERPEFDIHASMTPAKEVGGDFYDFFLIDDDHLAMVMADVSGKGVPAALFMMMSKILVGNYAMMGGAPSKVLEQVNTQICKNNDEEMFVTVWLGVLEISTGRVTAANAGHEYPIIRKPGGKFELFKDKHGFVIGGMDGMTFKEYEFTLEKGGTLFLYTDGVAEATDTNNELFGTDRMLETLNKDPDASPKELLKNMKQAVDEFVGEAPQFDDLTMLGLKLL